MSLINLTTANVAGLEKSLPTTSYWNVTDLSSSASYHPCDADEDIPEEERDTPGCIQYNFMIYTVLTGCLCVFGSVGNIVSFVVFCVDRLKTSASFLFQSLAVIDTFLLIGVVPFFCIPNFVSYTGW